MPASRDDILAAERVGITGSVTVGDILDILGILPVPDERDETGAVYWFYGWIDVNGAGLIQRMNRETSISASNTTSIADFQTAWDDRANLVYV